MVEHARTATSYSDTRGIPSPWWLLVPPLFSGTIWPVVASTPVPPLWLGLARVGLAGVALLAVGQRRRPSQVGHTLVLGLLNFGLLFALQAVAAHRLTAGVAATLASAQALLVPLLALLCWREPVSARHGLAALVGIGGIALMGGAFTTPVDPIGMAASLSSALCAASGLMLVRRWRRTQTARQLLGDLGWQMLAAAAVLAPVAWAVHGSIPLAAMSEPRTAALTAVIATVGTVLPFGALFLALHNGHSATAVSRSMLLAPVLATAAGWLVLDQSLRPTQLLGGAVVLAALAYSAAKRDPNLPPTPHVISLETEGETP